MQLAIQLLRRWLKGGKTNDGFVQTPITAIAVSLEQGLRSRRVADWLVWRRALSLLV